MVQVDVFWSYGLGSGLALAARQKLKAEPNPWVNKYFVATLAWIALLFAPSGLYLLWAFPYWETMFVATTHADLPAWLVTTFGFTNVSQGILGFYITYRLIRAGKDGAARLQTIWSHAAMLFILIFGWDGSGFSRFIYAGTGEEWRAGVPYAWAAWFSSPVFFTLASMAVVFVPTYTWLVLRFIKDGKA